MDIGQTMNCKNFVFGGKHLKYINFAKHWLTHGTFIHFNNSTTPSPPFNTSNSKQQKKKKIDHFKLFHNQLFAFPAKAIPQWSCNLSELPMFLDPLNLNKVQHGQLCLFCPFLTMIYFSSRTDQRWVCDQHVVSISMSITDICQLKMILVLSYIYHV